MILEEGEDDENPEGILIDIDDIIIDGNGHTIDAQKVTRIFKITGKNITLKNGYTQKNTEKRGGGAIYNEKGEITIQNSTLNNNTTKYGN
ncbi:MAG: hypothetical protein BZ137_09790 [Methanosphaera sp. rholeuAM130]|nr:MAG: hypothetical protein BZ137_09790 [Methanosphaera sp. rholeuAM130]